LCLLDHRGDQHLAEAFFRSPMISVAVPKVIALR
jgi:hypothetical protein